MKKKLSVILLSLVMVLTMMPVYVFADASDSSTDYLSFAAVDGDVTLSMKKPEESAEVTYEYSNNKDEWTDFMPGTTSINIAKDEKIYFRAKVDGQDFPGREYRSLKFLTATENGKLYAGGNIMSLVSKNCSETKMEEHGFQELFSGCTCLVTTPNLPATTLARSCYSAMFAYCPMLEEGPDELPAKELAKSCYSFMFRGCPNFVKAPYLPAETLVDNCYWDLFEGCSKLDSVSVGFKEWYEKGEGYFATDFWLDNVAAKGTFYCPSELDMSIRDCDHVPEEWVVSPFPPVEEYTVNFMDGDKVLDTKTVESGQTVKPIADPIREGCEFTGWYLDKKATEIFNFNTPITSDLTLYAGWKEVGPGPGPTPGPTPDDPIEPDNPQTSGQLSSGDNAMPIAFILVGFVATITGISAYKKLRDR